MKSFKGFGKSVGLTVLLSLLSILFLGQTNALAAETRRCKTHSKTLDPPDVNGLSMKGQYFVLYDFYQQEESIDFFIYDKGSDWRFGTLDDLNAKLEPLVSVALEPLTEKKVEKMVQSEYGFIAWHELTTDLLTGNKIHAIRACPLPKCGTPITLIEGPREVRLMDVRQNVLLMSVLDQSSKQRTVLEFDIFGSMNIISSTPGIYGLADYGNLAAGGVAVVHDVWRDMTELKDPTGSLVRNRDEELKVLNQQGGSKYHLFISDKTETYVVWGNVGAGFSQPAKLPGKAPGIRYTQTDFDSDSGHIVVLKRDNEPKFGQKTTQLIALDYGSQNFTIWTVYEEKWPYLTSSARAVDNGEIVSSVMMSGKPKIIVSQCGK